MPRLSCCRGPTWLTSPALGWTQNPHASCKTSLATPSASTYVPVLPHVRGVLARGPMNGWLAWWLVPSSRGLPGEKLSCMGIRHAPSAAGESCRARGLRRHESSPAGESEDSKARNSYVQKYMCLSLSLSVSVSRSLSFSLFLSLSLILSPFLCSLGAARHRYVRI